MHTALIIGYSAFDLGIFNDKDIRLKIIKKAIPAYINTPTFFNFTAHLC